jgi:hypothetical protein
VLKLLSERCVSGLALIGIEYKWEVRLGSRGSCTHDGEIVRRSQFHGLRFRDFTINVASDDVSRLGIGSDWVGFSDD